VTIDFEGLGDLTDVTSEFSGLGVTFTGATVLTAGLSLNELEFPPHSGTKVVFDALGAMSLSFAEPVSHVGGFFTYLTPVTLSGFDASGHVVAVATSSFSSNLALSGAPGSMPNEFLGITASAGISRLEILGDPFGGSFTLDDLGFEPRASIPGPGTLLLLSGGLVLGVRFRSSTSSARRIAREPEASR
jgi:hypothetical protein